MYVTGGEQGRGKWVRDPVKNIFRPLSMSRPAKTLHTNSEILTPSVRVTWAWSERVNLYNPYIIII
jgi:hypothetical protein